MRYAAATVGILAVLLIAAPAAAQADGQEVVEHRLTIKTTPPASGMVVMIDGEEYVTDGGGFIRARLVEGDHHVEARLVTEVDESMRLLYARWNDSFDRVRTVQMTRDRDLELGVLIQYNTEIRYVDGLGQPFPSDRVQSTVLINSNGDLTTVSSEPAEDDEGLEIGTLDQLWMTSNRLRRTGAGLISKEAVYSARQVFVDGEDVVQSGKVEYEPSRGGHWELQLRLYGLLVDVRSFGFNRPVDGAIGIRKAGEVEAFQVAHTVEGVAEFVNIPVGDFELTVEEGGRAPASPIVFSGPKTEIFTVVTPWVQWFGLFVIVLLTGSFFVFLIRGAWRIRILLGWSAVFILAMNVPTIGALGGRPLSLEVTPVFRADGSFEGIDAVVENTSAFSVSQVYCKPDFELRVLEGGGVWSATYESHDFHDVEFGECREHRVRPGTATYRLAPTLGQEWATINPEPLPPGEYVAYVRLFDIPAPAMRLELQNPINPAAEAYVVDDPTLGPEIPFASPFQE